MEVLHSEELRGLSILDEVSRDISSFSKEEIRDFIQRLQEEVEKHPQVEIPLQHHFSKDVYAREIAVPKGSLIIGKIHKFESLNILSKGKMTIFSIEGVKTVEAPFTVVSGPGVKRVGYAHEDSVWTTIHGTNEKDVEKIEEKFIAKTYEEVNEPLTIDIKQEDRKCLG